jgi:mitochondrial import receptor subunit TOM40
MASTSLSEKDAHPNPYAPATPIVPSYFNPVSPFFNAYDRFARWRADLGLPQPGSVENLQKEVKGKSLSPYLVTPQADLVFKPPIYLTIYSTALVLT